MSEHDYWDELAAGYALHGLSPDEQSSFITHLATCEACQLSVGEHELVAAQLGSISHYRENDEAPSWESMRASIMSSRSDTSTVVDLGAHRRRRYDVSRRLLAAAAALVVIAGGGIAVWRMSGNSSSCSTSHGCHTIHLDAAAGHTEASLVVRNSAITVTPTNMPAAPIGQTYVLWQLPRNGRATPVAEFTAGSGKTATGNLTVAYSDTSAFAVSVESSTGPPPSTPSNTLASGTVT
jgi:anti-sigma factor RsiW